MLPMIDETENTANYHYALSLDLNQVFSCLDETLLGIRVLSNCDAEADCTDLQTKSAGRTEQLSCNYIRFPITLLDLFQPAVEYK